MPYYLQEFSFSLKYVLVSKNINSDSLSLSCLPGSEEEDSGEEDVEIDNCLVATVDAYFQGVINEDEWKKNINQDVVLTEVKDCLNNGWHKAKD